MSIRLDPRRLSLLKNLAAGEDLRPGQLVQRWVEERLDAERHGEPVPTGGGAGPDTMRIAELETSVAALQAQVAEIVTAVGGAAPGSTEILPTTDQAPPAESEMPLDEPAAADEPPAEAPPRRRGRPRKTPAAGTTSAARVPLHEEIIAVIGERGPSTAAEIAEAINERGRYHAPRSDRPLDASTVNSRVSNPVYRSRFVRSGRRIGLAE